MQKPFLSRIGFISLSILIKQAGKTGKYLENKGKIPHAPYFPSLNRFIKL
jgi:hypothetical protein